MRTKTEGHFAKDIFLGTFLTVTKVSMNQQLHVFVEILLLPIV